MQNLTDAADRLVRRLRACPCDDIAERLEERTKHAGELHTRLRDAWSSTRVSLESLTAQVAAEAERVQQQSLAFVDALQGLAGRLSQLAKQLEPAFEQTEREVKAAEELATKTGKALDERLQAWSPAAAGGVVQQAQTKGSALVDALSRMSATLGGPLQTELQQRETLAQQFLDLAKTQGISGVKGLSACYEEWCVRISQVAGTVEREGADRLPPHAEEVVGASLVEVERLVRTSVEKVEAAVGSGVEALGVLRATAEDVGERADEQVRSLRDRAEQVARGFEWGLAETEAAAGRLSIFAERVS